VSTISFLFLLVFSSLNLNLNANEVNERPFACLSHGECQDLTSTMSGQRCLLVKTGYDVSGNVTCTVRCYPVSRGVFCRPLEDSVFGFCEREEFPVPQLDRMNPNCDGALDPLSL
jgi:hypothetical protein